MEWNSEYSFHLCRSGAKVSSIDVLPFDAPSAVEFVRARVEFIRSFLASIQGQLSLQSALDVGCGVGYFSGFLRELGLEVVGIDGRNENVEEAKRRFPDIRFFACVAETLPVSQIACADLVLCVGLLYHLENPFRAIRNLHAWTRNLLIVEGMCIPGTTAVMELLDERTLQDQGLNYVAFYPTEASLVKMLYRSGFPFVYRFLRLPAHPLYDESVMRQRQRTMLAASKMALSASNLLLTPEPVRHVLGMSDPWTTPLARLRYRIGELRRSILRLSKT
jgi:SAM-dependent methyltransferase